MFFQQKKKAFTLTELLVVVIVIGVLSAVVLPKFSKVMETRKTTEAEELMAAVRTEQEKRCALDQKYLSNLSAMKDIVPSADTKNFLYTTTATGIEAQSKGKYGYTLKMPSYEDGRLCCENAEECSKLNKDYPLCSDLIARADYENGAECAGSPTVIECSGSATQACGCLNKGTQTRTCDTSTGTWGAWSACSISNICDCTQVSGSKPTTETQECNGCGTQTRSYTCDTNTGSWVVGAWSACSKTAEECNAERDCCSSEVPASEFASCLLDKYGADSPEYICASGKNIGVLPGIGSLAGASACASKLMGFGCILRAANNTCESNDANCLQLREENIEWISGGFKNYACTGERPTTVPSKPVDPDETAGWKWQTADWSNALIRNGRCNTLNPSAIVADHCRESISMNGLSTSCPATPSEGARCQVSCSLGGKVYPKGTIMNYQPGTFSGPFNDMHCTCLGPMVGSGENAHCGGNQGCSPICVIPYTHIVKYAVKK